MPNAGRPSVDKLKGSAFGNMKELRFTVPDGDDRGEWRAAFAFDPKREAIVLVAASKSGTTSSLFYKRLVAIADKRYADHIAATASAAKRRRESK